MDKQLDEDFKHYHFAIVDLLKQEHDLEMEETAMDDLEEGNQQSHNKRVYTDTWHSLKHNCETSLMPLRSQNQSQTVIAASSSNIRS